MNFIILQQFKHFREYYELLNNPLKIFSQTDDENNMKRQKNKCFSNTKFHSRKFSHNFLKSKWKTKNFAYIILDHN